MSEHIEGVTQVCSCPYCGSKDIVVDSTSRWNVEKQEWIHESNYDSFICQDCDECFKYANWSSL